MSTTTQTPFHLALTGYPLGHSLSPLIHTAALQACGLQGEYVLRPVSPETISAELDKFAADLREGRLHGLNITIPHKQAVVKICDELTASAQMIGAVNLISLAGGKIIGDNSDARGFMAALPPLPTVSGSNHTQGRQALVLGAGGSARAVIYALASTGWQVFVTSRRIEQAERLVSELGPSASAFIPRAMAFPADPEFCNQLDLLVNTTPLGMTPNPSGCPWPSDQPLPAKAIIYDLVYNPRETTLLKLAAAQGLQTIGGIAMLVEQAAIAFECWTGRKAPREAMYAAVK